MRFKLNLKSEEKIKNVITLFLFTLVFFTRSAVANTDTATSELAASPQFSRLNLQIKPLGIMYGAFGGEIHYALSEELSAGVGASSYVQTTRTRERTYSEIAIMGAYQFVGQRFQTGWVSESSLAFVRTHSESLVPGVAAASTLLVDGNYLTSTVSHIWSWQSGINLQLGAGASFSLSDAEELFEPQLVWKFGYAF